MNDPAKPNWKMNGTPGTAVTIGTLLYNSWTTNGGNLIAPVIGCRVIANNTTGFSGFHGGEHGGQRIHPDQRPGHRR